MLINESEWNDKDPYVANKIPHGSAEPYHAPTGAYHEFRKEFYITRRKALYHERIAFYITSLCLVRQTTLSTCPVQGKRSNG